MNLVLFKARYPSFTDDTAIQLALDDAELLIDIYNIDDSKRDLAIALLTAHILTLQPTSGVSEPFVTKVKADTVEVEFSDKGAADNDWLSSTSYGRMFALLIGTNIKASKSQYGIIKDTDDVAIKFDDRVSYDGTIIQGQQDDKRFN